MPPRLLLDATPLSRLCHPRFQADALSWLQPLRIAGCEVFISAIVDYEVRRGLLAANMARTLTNLDFYRTDFIFCPLLDDDLLEAARLWADLRRRGLSTASPKELDGDAILAAQANRLNAIVATENLRHLSLMCQARDWREIKS